ncbi:MAG: MoaD/ThiS family protein [Flavobacteriales bacterium]|nr:MoaD/ThiS family protein [Flavobacteriales bacterium]
MRVHLFGILAEKAGSDVVELEGAATDELRAEFRRRFPNTKGLMFAMAVDRKVVNGNQPLNGNEEVAMLPPFAGG